ncbi:putative rhabdovirus nucleoprotein [Helianthus anomalus]
MHAYKLFCEVKENTGQETAWLVSKLVCSFFGEALETVDDISRNWDLGEPNTNLAFRYARMLGPNYFPAIQTKSCLALIAWHYYHFYEWDFTRVFVCFLGITTVSCVMYSCEFL